jgi:Ca2+-binding EF-hand superfamily protein
VRDVLFEKLAQKRAQKRSRRGATDTTLTDEETQMCDNLFDAIDANGDGELSHAEVETLFARPGYGAEFKQLFMPFVSGGGDR